MTSSPTDISVILTAHREGVLAGATANSARRAIDRVRQDCGLTSEVIIVLDRATAATRLVLENALADLTPTLLQTDLGDPGQPYKVGDVVQFPTPDGLGQYAGAVQQVKADGEAVQFDFNHPLAGRPVVFEVFVIGIL